MATTESKRCIPTPSPLLGKQFFSLFILGILVRLALAPFTAHPLDVHAWFLWVEEFLAGRYTALYVPPYPLAYIFSPIAVLYGFLADITGITPISIQEIEVSLRPPAIWPIQHVPGLLFNLLIKIPFILADIFTALLLYKLLIEILGDKFVAERISVLWFLNPLVIWVSSGWGMFDAIPALLTVATMYLALKRRAFISGILLVVAFSLKLYPAVLFVPLVAYYWHLGRGRFQIGRPVAKFVAGVALTAGIFYVPYSQALSRSLGGQLWVSEVSASVFPPQGILSYWSLALLHPIVNTIMSASLPLGIGLIGILYWKIFRRGFSNPIVDLSGAMLTSILVVFLTFRLVAENFVVWIIPFMALLTVLGKIESKLFWLVSSVAFIFSVTNNLLLFSLLPISPWLGEHLAALMEWVKPYRVMPEGIFQHGFSFGSLFLVGLGTLFSVLLALVLLEVLSGGKYRVVEKFFHEIRSLATRLRP